MFMLLNRPILRLFKVMSFAGSWTEPIATGDGTLNFSNADDSALLALIEDI